MQKRLRITRQFAKLEAREGIEDSGHTLSGKKSWTRSKEEGRISNELKSNEQPTKVDGKK